MSEDMKILLIGIVSIVILLALAFGFVYIRTDLKKLDEGNKQFINEDGDYVYYNGL
jgi:predicted permease